MCGAPPAAPDSKSTPPPWTLPKLLLDRSSVTHFDPKDLGAYYPPGLAPFRLIYTKLMESFFECMPNNYDFTRSQETEWHFDEVCSLEIYDGTMCPDELSIQEMIWKTIRHELVKGDIKAYSVDDDGKIREIVASFWATEPATVALSTGKIFPPEAGRDEERLCLYTSHVLALHYEYVIKFLNKYWKDFYSLEDQVQLVSMYDRWTGSQAEANSEGSANKKRVGGRPVMYDQALFRSLVLKVLEGENPPTKQVDMMEKAFELYITAKGTGHKPSESWLKKQVREALRNSTSDNNA